MRKLGLAVFLSFFLSTSGLLSYSFAQQEITFIAAQYSTETEPFWSALVADFEAENPDIRVDLQVVGWDVLGQTVNTMVATNQAPDLLNASNFAEFAADDLLLPVDAYASPELLAKFYPSFLEPLQYEGVTYALPFLASVRGLYYNKDLFEQAGIDAPPATWDELVEDALKIKEETGVDGFGVPMTNYEGQAYISYFIWGNGGDWKRDGEWVLNSPENVEAVQFLADLVTKEEVTNPQPTAINRDELHKVFGAGQLGMMISASFLPTILAADAPDLNYGYAPIPVNEGVETFTLGVEDVLFSFNTTQYPEAVGKLVAFIYDDARYEDFLTREGMLPITQAAGESMAATSERAAGYIVQLDGAKFYPLSDPLYAEVRLDLIEAMQRVMLGQASAQEALDSVQEKVGR